MNWQEALPLVVVSAAVGVTVARRIVERRAVRRIIALERKLGEQLRRLS